MDTVKFENLYVKGELAVRAGKNFARLEDKWYRPEEVFTADQHGWPGDWEGRIILALTLLSQSTHRTPAYLDEIVEELPKHFNEKGYLGVMLPEGQFDEQQMAGHSWLIRGLLEYYKITGNSEVKQMAENIINNLLLPACSYYGRYPIDGDLRKQKQDIWILSKLQTKTKHHAESSDAGCAFIMLDGATAAYEIFRTPRLKELIEEMISRYTEMDFLKLHIQTHATLSACRGIFRFYELTGEEKYLNTAEDIYGLYKEEALSEAFGNYNWFGIPRWTESCAIIDSFIMSVNLWRATKKPAYMEYAHYIFYNAVGHGQRADGGFGTDTCTGAKTSQYPLFLEPVTYDVYWCCNMRGGECLSRAIEYLFFTEDADIYVPFFNSCSAQLVFDDGILQLEEKSGYPYNGDILFEVKKNTCNSRKTLHVFLPPWIEKGEMLVNINNQQVEFEAEDGFAVVVADFRQGDKIRFSFSQTIKSRETEYKNSISGYKKYFYGPMLLGIKGDPGREEVILPDKGEFLRRGKSEFIVEGTDYVLSALCNVMDGTERNTSRQILFKNR